MLRKFISALRLKAKTRVKRFKPETKELALELALAFLLAAVTDGIDPDELEDLEERFKTLKDSLKPKD